MSLDCATESCRSSPPPLPHRTLIDQEDERGSDTLQELVPVGLARDRIRTGSRQTLLQRAMDEVGFGSTVNLHSSVPTRVVSGGPRHLPAQLLWFQLVVTMIVEGATDNDMRYVDCRLD